MYATVTDSRTIQSTFMRCPDCREFVMVEVRRLRVGEQVACPHCERSARLATKPLPDGAGCYWLLTGSARRVER